jgi:hypothetical protein
MMGFGAVVNAFGTMRAGMDEAHVQQFNARVSEQAAVDALYRGEHTANVVRSQGGQLIGRQRTEYASSGVDAGTGSALDVQIATAGLTELDAQTARSNAAREAWGYRIQAANARARASAAEAAGQYGYVGSILGGAGAVAGSSGS